MPILGRKWQCMFFTAKKTQLVKQNESKNLNVNSESHLGCLLGELFCICNDFSTYLVFLLLPLNHFALPLGHLVFFIFYFQVLNILYLRTKPQTSLATSKEAHLKVPSWVRPRSRQQHDRRVSQQNQCERPATTSPTTKPSKTPDPKGSLRP